MSDSLAFAKRIDSMSEEDKAHFKRVIEALSYCYVEEVDRKAVIVLESSSGLMETITINCDDMEAYEIASSATQYLEFVNTKDAPPKEKFN